MITRIRFSHRSCRLRAGAFVVLSLLIPVSRGSAAGVDYLTEIKPLLASRCYACHGALKAKSGLRLDTVALMRKGGDGGDVLDREAPLLFDRVTAADVTERMPPEGEGAPLTAEEAAKIRKWIDSGAPAPESETPEASPSEHWAFQPIVRPPVPKVKNQEWVRNPIDAFVAETLESKGLTPAPPAPAQTQLRRLYLDLIGLPPTAEAIDAWTDQPSEEAYRKSVGGLLSDTRHGERWARHWMDIWRYSDWWGLGAQLRNSQKNIWHWRDWIVESLNEDTPYDEMVRLMLAADEIVPEDLNALRATGYLARNWFLFNRNQWMDETVEHVSKGFLGLTVNCAKCHDHKYDPIAQKEYYALRSVFEPYMVRNDVLPGYVDLSADDLPRAYDARPDDPTYLFVRGDDKNPDKSRIVDPGVLGFLKFADYAPQRVKLPVESYRPGLRPHVREAQLQNAEKKLAESRAALTEAESQWNATKSRPAPADTKADSGKGTISETLPADTLIAFLKLNAADRNRSEAEEWSSAIKARLAADLAMRDESNSAAAETMSQKAAEAERRHALAASEAEIARLELQLAQADAKQNGQLSESLKKARAQRDESRKLVSEGKPGRHTPIAGAANAKTMFLSSTKFDPDPVFPPYSTGRRKALGDWITDERNPLTARVAVNHVWARHFGVPLVPTVFDFGRKGLPPSHPKLLDWLAAEFVESGWSMKRLHALIVESSTYRMSSSAKGLEENSKLDPDNRWLWRRTPVRVESQVVRDSVLSLAGTLETTMGGPPVPMTAQESSKRRSLYFFHSNNERNDFLTTFDEALVRDCYQRDRSIVPQQALALSNSKLVLDAAPAIARRIVADSKRAGNAAPDDAAFVDRAFLTLLGFRPSADELAACLDAIKSWRNGHPAEEAAEIGRTRLVWALINHNDFVTQR